MVDRKSDIADDAVLPVCQLIRAPGENGYSARRFIWIYIFSRRVTACGFETNNKG
jgi:hypothetical protein